MESGDGLVQQGCARRVVESGRLRGLQSREAEEEGRVGMDLFALDLRPQQGQRFVEAFGGDQHPRRGPRRRIVRRVRGVRRSRIGGLRRIAVGGGLVVRAGCRQCREREQEDTGGHGEGAPERGEDHQEP